MSVPGLIPDGRVKELIVSHPTSLDTVLQQDVPYGSSRFDGGFVTAALKCGLLFSPHVLWNDAQLFDHRGIRDLMLRAGRAAEPGLLDLLREPWHDGLGPVILASEERQGQEPLPLSEQLLIRKLHVEDDEKAPMEFSSFLHPMSDNDELRGHWSRSRERSRLFELYCQMLGEHGRVYPDFLRAGDAVWWEKASITRIAYPFQQGAFARTFVSIIQASMRQCPCSEIADVDLAEWAAKRPPATRSEARHFFRDRGIDLRSGPGAWWNDRINEAYYATLASGFRGGDLTSHEALGWRTLYRGPETPLEHSRRKREYAAALSQVLKDLSKSEDLLVDLDRITFRTVHDVRGSQAFIESLQDLVTSWGKARSPEEASEAATSHTKVVLAELERAGVRAASRGQVTFRTCSTAVVAALLGGGAAAVGVAFSAPSIAAWAGAGAGTAIFGWWALQPHGLRSRMLCFAKELGKASVA